MPTQKNTLKQGREHNLKEKILSAELDSFDQLVDELERAIRINTTPNIKTEKVECNHKTFFTNEINVGKMSEDMMELGFQQHITYDLTHFLRAMCPESEKIGGVLHGHSLTSNDLRFLPEIVNNPIAIVSSTKNDLTINKEKLLILGMTRQPEKGYAYSLKIAAIVPQATSEQILSNHNVSKVVTYYNTTPKKFAKILNQTSFGERHLVYFNKERFRELEKSGFISPCVLPSKDVVPKDIKFFCPTSLRIQNNIFRQQVIIAATKEVERYADAIRIDYSDSNFGPFVSAIKSIESLKGGPTELINAKRIIDKTIDLVGDQYLAKKTYNRVAPYFANAYNFLFREENLDRIAKDISNQIEKYAEYMLKAEITTDFSDFTDRMWDKTDQLLNEYNISFDGMNSENNKHVAEAIKQSKNNMMYLNSAVGDIVFEIENTYEALYKQKEPMRELEIFHNDSIKYQFEVNREIRCLENEYDDRSL